MIEITLISINYSLDKTWQHLIPQHEGMPPMTRTFGYTVTRKPDGAEVHSGTIEDHADQGMKRTAKNLKSSLINSHPMAKGLSEGEIDIEMSVIK
ncbi:hypothetical protein [Paracoccus methylarcula]|nr:hypothetical protein [Paracoccus methylarcula]